MVYEGPAAAELERAIGAGPDLLGATDAERANQLRRWHQVAARTRPRLERWRTLAVYPESLGAATGQTGVAQLPHVPGDRWVGGQADPQARLPAGRVSLVLHRAARPAATGVWSGVLLDEWTEIVPGATELTAIAYNHDAPAAEAPQTLLIAVPPTDAPVWDLDTLLAIVTETVDLARLRAVDGDLLGSLGMLLPAIHLAFNREGDTISTDFRRLRTAGP